MKQVRLLRLAAFVAMVAAAQTANAKDQHDRIYQAPYQANIVTSTLGERLIQAMEAEKGTTRYRHRSLWCADYVNEKLASLGVTGTGSREAISFQNYGAKEHEAPQRGDIVVTRRRGGNHVGILLGTQGDKLQLISGNHSHTVGIGLYPRGRVVAIRKLP